MTEVLLIIVLSVPIGMCVIALAIWTINLIKGGRKW